MMLVSLPESTFPFTYHTTMYYAFTLTVNGKKSVKIWCSLWCLQWNKNKYRDHKYQHLVWSAVKRCAFIEKVRNWNRAPRPIQTAAKCSQRVFIGLCIRANRVRMRTNVRLRLRWCTYGWARLMFVFYLYTEYVCISIWFSFFSHR